MHTELESHSMLIYNCVQITRLVIRSSQYGKRKAVTWKLQYDRVERADACLVGHPSIWKAKGSNMETSEPV